MNTVIIHLRYIYLHAMNINQNRYVINVVRCWLATALERRTMEARRNSNGYASRTKPETTENQLPLAP